MTATSTILAVAALASAAVGAAGAVQQGQAAKRQAAFTAAVQRQQAERERLAAEALEKDKRRESSRLMAQRRAIMGASGVDSTTGSPLLGSEAFEAEAELAALRIRDGGEVNATRLEQSAVLQGLKGKNAQTAGYMRAGSLLISGAGKSYEHYMDGK